MSTQTQFDVQSLLSDYKEYEVSEVKKSLSKGKQQDETSESLCSEDLTILQMKFKPGTIEDF